MSIDGAQLRRLILCWPQKNYSVLFFLAPFLSPHLYPWQTVECYLFPTILQHFLQKLKKKISFASGKSGKKHWGYSNTLLGYSGQSAKTDTIPPLIFHYNKGELYFQWNAISPVLLIALQLHNWLFFILIQIACSTISSYSVNFILISILLYFALSLFTSV